MKHWPGPSVANSSKHPPNPASTSTTPSTTSSAKLDATIRRWQATRQAAAVDQAAVTPQARWKLVRVRRGEAAAEAA